MPELGTLLRRARRRVAGRRRGPSRRRQRRLGCWRCFQRFRRHDGTGGRRGWGRRLLRACDAPARRRSRRSRCGAPPGSGLLPHIVGVRMMHFLPLAGARNGGGHGPCRAATDQTEDAASEHRRAHVDGAIGAGPGARCRDACQGNAAHHACPATCEGCRRASLRPQQSQKHDGAAHVLRATRGLHRFVYVFHMSSVLLRASLIRVRRESSDRICRRPLALMKKGIQSINEAAARAVPRRGRRSRIDAGPLDASLMMSPLEKRKDLSAEKPRPRFRGLKQSPCRRSPQAPACSPGRVPSETRTKFELR